MTRLLHLLWLVAVWVALWSDLSVANVVSGTVVAAGIVRILGSWRQWQLALRPIPALKFTVYFLYKLVEASLIVARTVIAPGDRIRAGVVAVGLGECTDAVTTLIAGTISLTPGTLTVEVRREPLTLYVHVLHLRDVEEVRRGIRTLEALATDAFGGRAAGAAHPDITIEPGGPS